MIKRKNGVDNNVAFREACKNNDIILTEYSPAMEADKIFHKGWIDNRDKVEMVKIYAEKALREQREQRELGEKSLRKLEEMLEEMSGLEEIFGCKIFDEDEEGRIKQSMEMEKLGKLIEHWLQPSPEAKEMFKPLEMKYLAIEDEVKVVDKK